MFLFVPLFLILASAVGIFVIAWRKMPYLKKLSVTEVPADSSVWRDFFPEFHTNINDARLKHYRQVWLLEIEKILRRLRVVSLKMDRASDSWIKKLRNITDKKHDKSHVIVGSEAKGADVTKKEEHPIAPAAPKIEDLRKEEQRLIIEIAKNPKNATLYETLGDLYVKMDNFADAKESYEAAMELSPGKGELIKKHSQAVENMIK